MPAARSLPNDKKGHGAAILAALEKHGGSMTPSQLMAAVGASNLATLRYRMTPLFDVKQVIATGTTVSRRFSLPGRVPKEGL